MNNNKKQIVLILIGGIIVAIVMVPVWLILGSVVVTMAVTSKIKLDAPAYDKAGTQQSSELSPKELLERRKAEIMKERRHQ